MNEIFFTHVVFLYQSLNEPWSQYAHMRRRPGWVSSLFIFKGLQDELGRDVLGCKPRSTDEHTAVLQTDRNTPQGFLHH